MCTVVIRVPEAEGPIRMLAVRDEDPTRGWVPLGENWPERPGVIGVRDARAGGAWLAADAAEGRLAVLLNRQSPEPPPGVTLVTRGAIPLDAVAGRPPQPTVATAGFNLVTVDAAGAVIVTWDGVDRTETRIPPGTHMIAHRDLDDTETERIIAWRGPFTAASTEGSDDDWWMPWLDVLRESGGLSPVDARAIVRDNEPLGYPTQTTLLCVASVAPGDLDVKYAQFTEPGHWNTVIPR
ncbi:NRDE family protein [Microbacterium candidum]|uniref:NRDE family protein n=1 Tax=Microbacterium candidum TaxID=3041922 RepID=A0ABT7MVM4_9MICO|nr:NRDE family protein [Microbacterium sp. ASV49]MDL9978505.1 NRDE family protein [Microbacterium sp. ASV49]